MLDRDDLTFATCFQLAGEIREEWEERPEDVDKALVVLTYTNEPEDVIDTFREPLLQVPVMQVLSAAMKMVLSTSDGWKTPKADMLKKELVSRIKDYERRTRDLTRPVLEPVYITV